jgi:hypothetical protein
MTDIQRVKAVWTGFPGGPGVSTFYTSAVGIMVPAVHTFFVTLLDLLPSDVSIQVESSGDTIDDANGAITGSWVSPPQPVVVGGFAGTYSAPSGACITWLTDAVVAGHRLKGRTFIVPLGTNAYQNDGTIAPANLAIIQGAATLLSGVLANGMLVLARPFAGAPAVPPKPARPARAGVSAPVTGSRVADKAAVLRSRRD